MKRLDHYWYSQNPLAWVLLPLSWLFCIVSMLRRFLYIKGLLSTYAMPVPVIIIGNITVGGTGKTPLLIGLSEYLLQHGFQPGIVSRGYGSTITGERSVAANDAAMYGDEPVLIRKRTACPVVIGSDRVAAATKLLAENDCDIVLSDDGMQHYRLKRDIEIAVVDTQRNFGNGYCIPAGPLREPLSRLNKVNMVVRHGDTDDKYCFYLEFGKVINLETGVTRALESFAGEKIHALAGIGHPQRFFDQLRNRGLDIIEHVFPDHHVYTAGDFNFADGRSILMTEKDAVKCTQTQLNSTVLGNAWTVPVSARMSDQLGPDLIALINQCR